MQGKDQSAHSLIFAKENLAVKATRHAATYIFSKPKAAFRITEYTHAGKRKKMDNQFRRLYKSIDALAFVNGEEPYQTLASNINQLVANAQQTLKQAASARETRMEKKKNT